MNAHVSHLSNKGVYSLDRVSNTHKYPLSTGIQRKAWKTNRKVRKMVLGSDVGLEETCRMALCGLVGRFSYSYLSKGPVEDWVIKHWKPLLGYEP